MHLFSWKSFNFYATYLQSESAELWMLHNYDITMVFFIKCNNCNTNNSIVITVIILIIIIIISIITQVNILIEMEHFLSNTGTKKHVHTYTTIAFMPTPINEFLCAHVWAHESVCMCALLLVS